MWNVNTITLRQVLTPMNVLGRMNATYRMVLFGALPVGALLAGPARQHGRVLARDLDLDARADHPDALAGVLPRLPPQGTATRPERRKDGRAMNGTNLPVTSNQQQLWFIDEFHHGFPPTIWPTRSR